MLPSVRPHEQKLSIKMSIFEMSIKISTKKSTDLYYPWCQSLSCCVQSTFGQSSSKSLLLCSIWKNWYVRIFQLFTALSSTIYPIYCNSHKLILISNILHGWRGICRWVAIFRGGGGGGGGGLLSPLIGNCQLLAKGLHLFTCIQNQLVNVLFWFTCWQTHLLSGLK